MDLESSRYSGFGFEVIHGGKAQAELESLLNRSFGVPQGGSFLDDFPVWDERFGVEIHRVGVYVEDLGRKTLIATASVRYARMRTSSGLLPVGLIGCVATEEVWRGRGLASHAVTQCAEWAHSRGAALVLLWGSELSLYQRLGFELCGSQMRVPLERIVSSHEPMIQAGEGWTPSLMKHFRRRSDGLLLGEADQSWLSAHKNVQWFWAGSAEDPKAYLAIGRGIDLAGFVHEWGGERESLINLLGHVNHRIPGLELLGAPWHFKKYGILTDQCAEEYLCLAKILEPNVVLAAYGITDPTVARGLKDRELTRSFFGSRARGDDLRALELPLWVWGLDGA